jgi:hypothetical protein
MTRSLELAEHERQRESMRALPAAEALARSSAGTALRMATMRLVPRGGSGD